MTSSGGLHTVSSTAFWSSSSVKDWARTRALQVRQNTLPTASRLAKWYPARNLSPACTLCGAPQDTLAHRLGACTAPAIKNQICARHGHAVHKIAMEIGMGSYGGSALLTDAECHERYDSFPSSVLSLNRQTSRPDLVLAAGF